MVILCITFWGIFFSFCLCLSHFVHKCTQETGKHPAQASIPHIHTLFILTLTSRGNLESPLDLKASISIYIYISSWRKQTQKNMQNPTQKVPLSYWHVCCGLLCFEATELFTNSPCCHHVFEDALSDKWPNQLSCQIIFFMSVCFSCLPFHEPSRQIHRAPPASGGLGGCRSWRRSGLQHSFRRRGLPRSKWQCWCYSATDTLKWMLKVSLILVSAQ